MNLGQHILVFGVRMYRWVISPAKLFVFGSLSRCRFNPSCSAYALEAISRHGVCHGTVLAIKRICRCHPWGGCGDDPVPPLKPAHKSDQNRIVPALTSPSSQAPSGAHRLSVAGQSCH
jgi:putative membrane protein insertion efficiency factor